MLSATIAQLPALPATDADRPTPRDFVAISAAALAVRIVVFAVVSITQHKSPIEYANLYDGHSYVIVARAMAGEPSELDDYHGRVFPGYPAAVAVLYRLGVPLPAAALGLDWVAAGLAAALAAGLFADRRIGWAMAFLIPHYLMNSTMAMSEAPLLAMSLGGLALLHRRPAASGVMLALATFIRPMGVFALGAGLIVLIARRRWASFAWTALSAALCIAAGLALLHHWRGDALACYRYQATSHAAYAGQLITWPFRSLLTTPRQMHLPFGDIIYIWLHVVCVLAGCAAMVVEVRRPRIVTSAVYDRTLLAAPWLWANTAFILCTGNEWGFRCFHRFTVPALPALFWALRRILPRHWAVWTAIAVGSAALAVVSVR